MDFFNNQEMIEKIFYQSSLPRSGSTLLQNIMFQNPDFYCTPTDGVLDLLFASRNAFNSGHEFKAQDEKKMNKAFVSFCSGGIYGFYSALTPRKYVLSKNRSYAIFYDLMNTITPNAKMICMLRDIRECVASFETKYRKNPLYNDGMIDWATLRGTSTLKRADFWLNNNPLGSSLEKIKDTLQQGHGQKILFVKFEDLCESPHETMQLIYEYLEVPYYEHDFNNILQSTHENDRIHGIYGDHKIKNTLTIVEPKALKLLGEETCDFIYNNMKWYYDTFNYKY